MNFDTPTAESFFENNPVAEELDKIAIFQYAIFYTKFPLLKDPQIINVLTGLLVSKITSRLDETGVFAADNLNVNVNESGELFIVFSDDVYHFSLVIDDEKFIFQRQGSALVDFFETCDLIMPTVVEVFSDISAYIQGLRGSPESDPFHFAPHTCSYKFVFGLRNFKPSGKSTRNSIPNYELMERIVPSTQTKSSPLSEIGFKTRGRTDLNVSGTLDFEETSWFSWVHIDTPGNNNYSTMNLDLQISSLYHDFGYGRKPFDESSIGKWQSVILTFLKENVFNSFLKSWLSDVNFESSEQVNLAKK